MLLLRVAHGGDLPGGVNVSPLFVVVASFTAVGAGLLAADSSRSRAPSHDASEPRPDGIRRASILRGVSAAADTVVVLDFGSQYTQVIARRIREARVRSVVLPFDATASEVAKLAPKGIILSGGPSSVYDTDAPRGDAGLFDLKVPVLGLCYGMMWLAQRFGGKVGSAPGREYGRAYVKVAGGRLFRGLGPVETIWMSHGDHVEAAPAGFSVTATTENAPVAAFEETARGLYGIQGHPEVHHSEHGAQMLENFLYDVCGAKPSWTMAGFRDTTIARLREELGQGVVLGALSGGVDSTVAAVLLREAVGERFRGVFVDTGLLRKNEGRQVLEAFRHLGLPVVGVDASKRFFEGLAGVADPERKRKIIGGLFIDVFTENARAVDGAEWLAQGTLYPDVIESVSIKGPSSVIKTHHNVGGLPEKLGFKLVEPLRELFKDEVRRLGEELGIPRGDAVPAPVPGSRPRRPHPRRDHARARAHPPGGRRDLHRGAAGLRLVRREPRRRSPSSCPSRRSASWATAGPTRTSSPSAP